MQETQVRFLIQEGRTCCGATSSYATTAEPALRSPHAASMEAHVPGDSRNEWPEHRNKEELPAAAPGEKPSQP